MSKDKNKNSIQGYMSGVRREFDTLKRSNAYKFVTSNILSRGISVVTASLAITGLVVASVPAAIAGLVSVGVGAAIDTFNVRNTRQLKQENDLLTKNRTAKSKQDYLLKLEPKIAAALKEDLYSPDRENKKSVNTRYIEEHKQPTTNLYSFGRALLKNAIGAVTSIGQGVASGNSIKILAKAGQNAWGLYSETNKNNSLDNKQRLFQRQIDAERNKPDTPGYNNKRELRFAVRNQRIQTLAIQELIINGSYRNSTPEQIRMQFRDLKAKIEKTETSIKEARNPVIGKIRSVAKDIARAHNPWSSYYSPAQLDVASHSNLTKAAEKHETTYEKTPPTIFAVGKKDKPQRASTANEVSLKDAELLNKIKASKVTLAASKHNAPINLKTRHGPKEHSR